MKSILHRLTVNTAQADEKAEQHYYCAQRINAQLVIIEYFRYRRLLVIVFVIVMNEVHSIHIVTVVVVSVWIKV